MDNEKNVTHLELLVKHKHVRLDHHQEIGFPLTRGLSKDSDCEVGSGLHCGKPTVQYVDRVLLF